jgi:CheY-specific phosphatase CheX
MRSICASTQKTFSTQIGLNLTTGEPRLWREEQATDVAVIGKMDIDSPLFHGSIGIAFSAPVFLALYEKMFGESHSEISPELQDAAAEFMNIIYGTTKSELNQRPGYNLQPILPSVLCGEALQNRHAPPRSVVLIPFQSEVGPFHLEVALHRNHGKAAA